MNGLSEIPTETSRLASQMGALVEGFESPAAGTPARGKLSGLFHAVGASLAMLTALSTVPGEMRMLADFFVARVIEPFFPKPHTSVTSNEMTMEYDRKLKTFAFSFPLVLQNTGNANDTLSFTKASVYLSPGTHGAITSDNIKNSSTQHFDASPDDFAPYAKGRSESLAAESQVLKPIPVAKNETKVVPVVIRFPFASFEKAEWNLLAIELDHNHHNAQFRYCFHLNEEDIKEIKEKKELGTDWRKPFSASKCGA